MSCGPDTKQLAAIDAINNAVATSEKFIAALPKKVASVPGYAEVQLLLQINQDLQNLKALIDDPLALAEALIPSLPLEITNYIEQGNKLAGDSADFLQFIENLDDKYGDFDYGNPEDLLQAMNDIGGDINQICQKFDNIQKRKGEFIKKGKPLSGSVNQVNNPISHVKFKSIPLVKEYVDGFNKEETANKKEVDVNKAETSRFLSQE